jgi:hypothetical protein
MFCRAGECANRSPPVFAVISGSDEKTRRTDRTTVSTRADRADQMIITDRRVFWPLLEEESMQWCYTTSKKTKKTEQMKEKIDRNTEIRWSDDLLCQNNNFKNRLAPLRCDRTQTCKKCVSKNKTGQYKSLKSLQHDATRVPTSTPESIQKRTEIDSGDLRMTAWIADSHLHRKYVEKHAKIRLWWYWAPTPPQNASLFIICSN